MADETLWYYLQSGLLGDAQVGPIRETDLTALVEKQKVTAKTQVCSPTATAGQWVPLRKTDLYQRLLSERAERRRSDSAAPPVGPTTPSGASPATSRPPTGGPPPPPGPYGEPAEADPLSGGPSGGGVAPALVGPSSARWQGGGPVLAAGASQGLPEADGLLRGLFEFEFRQFAAPTLVRVFYVLAMVIIAIETLAIVGGGGLFIAGSVVSLIGGAAADEGDGRALGFGFGAGAFGIVVGVVWIALGLLWGLLSLAAARLGLEVVMLIFDTANSLRRLRGRI